MFILEGGLGRFKLGSHLLPFNVDDVVAIIGLPSKGRVFHAAIKRHQEAH